MITFKHTTDEAEWKIHPKGVPYNEIANRNLKRLVSFIGALTVLFGWGPVHITSYWRPKDEDSYHSIFQAADIRVHDKPKNFKTILSFLIPILRMVDKNLQIYLHYELDGKPMDHVHLAYKDGSLKRD